MSGRASIVLRWRLRPLEEIYCLRNALISPLSTLQISADWLSLSSSRFPERLNMTELSNAQDSLRTAANAGSARLGSQADQAGNDNRWEKDAQGG